MARANASGVGAVAGSVLILALAVALGAAPLPPPADPGDSGPGDFSATRAASHIELIAREPHPMGSAAIERVRSLIVERLGSLGLEPELQATEALDYYGPRPDPVTVVNVMARIPGTASTGAVLLLGHYDTVPATPGANDDASAVAVILEAARATLAGPGLRNDVILLFTDGEEPAPRFGSTAFVTAHPWARDVAFAINLETIGSGGPSTLLQVSGPRSRVVAEFATAAPYPVAFSYITTLLEVLGGSNTDFSLFRDAGVAGLELAWLHGSPIYHTPADSPDHVSGASLYQQGANTLALARRLGDLDLARLQDEPASVFFTVGRWAVVRYPAAWNAPLAFVAGMLLAIGAWRRRRWRGLAAGTATSVASIVVATAAGTIAWLLLAGLRKDMGIAEAYLYLAGLLAMTAAIGVGVGRLVRHRVHAEPEPAGGLVVPWLLAMAFSIALPGIGYLLVWPCLAGGIVALQASEGARSGWRGRAGVAVVGVTTAVILVPPIDTFFQMAQPRPGNPDSQILAVVGVSVVLMVIAVELVRSALPQAPATGGPPPAGA